MSVLSEIGKVFEKIFVVGEKVAVAAEPTMNILFPGISTIFDTVANEAALVEAAAKTANAQSGTGAQKAAIVAANVAPSVLQTAVESGLAVPTATELVTIISGVVTVMNALRPAGTTTAIAAPSGQTSSQSASESVPSGTMSSPIPVPPINVTTIS